MERFNAGIKAFDSGDYGEAYALLIHYAEEGNAEAQCIIGNIYDLSLGRKRDRKLAVQWYKKSADQGYGIASNNLATIFNIGDEEVEPDLEKAHYWRQRAIEQGFIHGPSLS